MPPPIKVELVPDDSNGGRWPVDCTPDVIRITGSKGALLHTLAAAEATGSAAPEVLSFVPKWRPLGDSNPCYRRERAVS